MSIASRTWTYADLADWPESTSGLVEIIDGELIVTPAPNPPHELLTMELIFNFGEVVRPGRLGRIFTAPTDVLLPDGGVLQPDLVFIRSDRLGIVGKAAIEGPPDIVVEIFSPSSRVRDLGRKKEIYSRARGAGVLDRRPRAARRDRLRPRRRRVQAAPTTRWRRPFDGAARFGD